MKATAGKQNASPQQVAQWWAEYQKSGSEEARNHLLEQYLHIVKYTADRLYAKLPDEVDLDDLISAGVFGLMDAVKAYDPARGVKFETYCAPRVRGAILDELRSLDWVPRLVRARAHKVSAAMTSLEAVLGRRPSESELADAMELSAKEFWKLRREAKAVGLVSLSRKWYETDASKDVREIDVIEDKRSEDPVLAAQRKDMKELVTRGLSRAQRLIIMLYYFEGMTMKEIGQTLDLSESRVSQMHSAILDRLRGHLEKRLKELQATRY